MNYFTRASWWYIVILTLLLDSFERFSIDPYRMLHFILNMFGLGGPDFDVVVGSMHSQQTFFVVDQLIVEDSDWSVLLVDEVYLSCTTCFELALLFSYWWIIAWSFWKFSYVVNVLETWVLEQLVMLDHLFSFCSEDDIEDIQKVTFSFSIIY